MALNTNDNLLREQQKKQQAQIQNPNNVQIPSSFNSDEIVLELKDFSKRYRRRGNYAVMGVNIKVKKGEFHGFIGANGAGKTTTIKSIIGAYARFEGKVLIFGKDNRTKEAKSKIGYIPEAASFPKGFSTKAYIMHMAMLSGMKKKDASKFAIVKLRDLGLGNIAGRNPNKLSSGQKKKVLLAQALIHNPQVIIMDEPAANLDPKARMDFFQALTNLAKQGVTIFISSHILDELQKYVDSLTIIDGGKVVFSGKTAELNKADNKDETRWILKVTNRDNLMKLFKKEGINYEISNQNFIFNSTNKNLMSLLKNIVDPSIGLDGIQSADKDLSNVYNKYVQRGSLEASGKEHEGGIRA